MNIKKTIGFVALVITMSVTSFAKNNSKKDNKQEMFIISQEDLVLMCKQDLERHLNLSDRFRVILSALTPTAQDFSEGQRGCCGQENFDVQLPSLEYLKHSHIYQIAKKDLGAAQQLITSDSLMSYFDSKVKNKGLKDYGNVQDLDSDGQFERFRKYERKSTRLELYILSARPYLIDPQAPGSETMSFRFSSDEILKADVGVKRYNPKLDNFSTIKEEQMYKIPKNFNCIRRVSLYGYGS